MSEQPHVRRLGGLRWQDWTLILLCSSNLETFKGLHIKGWTARLDRHKWALRAAADPATAPLVWTAQRGWAAVGLGQGSSGGARP